MRRSDQDYGAGDAGDSPSADTADFGVREDRTGSAGGGDAAFDSVDDRADTAVGVQRRDADLSDVLLLRRRRRPAVPIDPPVLVVESTPGVVRGGTVIGAQVGRDAGRMVLRRRSDPRLFVRGIAIGRGGPRRLVGPPGRREDGDGPVPGEVRPPRGAGGYRRGAGLRRREGQEDGGGRRRTRRRRRGGGRNGLRGGGGERERERRRRRASALPEIRGPDRGREGRDQREVHPRAQLPRPSERGRRRRRIDVFRPAPRRRRRRRRGRRRRARHGRHRPIPRIPGGHVRSLLRTRDGEERRAVPRRHARPARVQVGRGERDGSGGGCCIGIVVVVARLCPDLDHDRSGMGEGMLRVLLQLLRDPNHRGREGVLRRHGGAGEEGEGRGRGRRGREVVVPRRGGRCEGRRRRRGEEEAEGRRVRQSGSVGRTQRRQRQRRRHRRRRRLCRRRGKDQRAGERPGRRRRRLLLRRDGERGEGPLLRRRRRGGVGSEGANERIRRRRQRRFRGIVVVGGRGGEPGGDRVLVDAHGRRRGRSEGRTISPERRRRPDGSVRSGEGTRRRRRRRRRTLRRQERAVAARRRLKGERGRGRLGRGGEERREGVLREFHGRSVLRRRRRYDTFNPDDYGLRY
mmetsp:Transcript_55305/g.165787  ORF Transcript_55305/g.165787 Transcript_55305/m.165787 type:complete len:630 (-) Transcript_55305:135-2024(-)